MKLTMLKGLPASGKSTFARSEVVSTGNSARINRDDLRAMMFNSVWSGKRESVTVDCEKAIAEVLFRHGMNPIIDDTNLSKKHRDMWRSLAESGGNIFHVNDLGTGADECRNRDSLRDRRVGRAVIDRMALQNDLISWGRRPIVLCDIDGTLADGEHRVHYVKGEAKDWKTYFSLLSEDTLIEHVATEIKALWHRHTICLVSGRPDTYQHETTAWLDRYAIPYNWLFMRAGSDKRPDTVVKADFLKCMPKEKIVRVFDDRPSVCRMWEENGLTVDWVRGRDCEEF